MGFGKLSLGFSSCTRSSVKSIPFSRCLITHQPVEARRGPSAVQEGLWINCKNERESLVIRILARKFSPFLFELSTAILEQLIGIAWCEHWSAKSSWCNLNLCWLGLAKCWFCWMVIQFSFYNPSSVFSKLGWASHLGACLDWIFARIGLLFTCLFEDIMVSFVIINITTPHISNNSTHNTAQLTQLTQINALMLRVVLKVWVLKIGWREGIYLFKCRLIVSWNLDLRCSKSLAKGKFWMMLSFGQFSNSSKTEVHSACMYMRFALQSVASFFVASFIVVVAALVAVSSIS